MWYKTKLFKATNNATPGRCARVTANEPYCRQYVNLLTTDTQTTRRNEKINVVLTLQTVIKPDELLFVCTGLVTSPSGSGTIFQPRGTGKIHPFHKRSRMICKSCGIQAKYETIALHENNIFQTTFWHHGRRVTLWQTEQERKYISVIKISIICQ